jgi:hypothetical protein
MSFPGEGPHAVGIDRKANDARHRRLGGSVASTGSEVPACGDRPQSESLPGRDTLAVEL